jgi:hypothetical protein
MPKNHSLKDALHTWLAAEMEAERSLTEFREAKEVRQGPALETLFDRAQQARQRANRLSDALLNALETSDSDISSRKV